MYRPHVALTLTALLAAPLVAKPLRENPGQEGTPRYISLLSKTNAKLTDSLGNYAGNNLGDLPLGEKFFAKRAFKIEGGVIQLRGINLKKDRPAKVEGIKVDRAFAKVHILHATGFGAQGGPGDTNFTADGTVIAEYKIHYADKTSVVIPVEYGRDVRDWNDQDESKPVTRGIVGWTGTNDLGRERQRQGAKYGNKLRLYVTTWENPNPRKPVTNIDYESKNTICAPFCVAITVE
jgi:hypothetical protein